MFKDFYSCYKPENFRVKRVKHVDFNDIILESISNGESPQTGAKFAYAQIWSTKCANARNLKIGMGTVICNQTS